MNNKHAHMFPFICIVVLLALAGYFIFTPPVGSLPDDETVISNQMPPSSVTGTSTGTISTSTSTTTNENLLSTTTVPTTPSVPTNATTTFELESQFELDLSL